MPAEAARVRIAVASALVALPPRVDAVIVVKHTGQPDLVWRPERDRWAHELTDAALDTILASARAAGFAVEQRGRSARAAATRISCARCGRPRRRCRWMPIIRCSSSTRADRPGKPKGVVHVHGGYAAGIAHTMTVAFDARPGDVIYVVADPGWITGQSYLISRRADRRA